MNESRDFAIFLAKDGPSYQLAPLADHRVSKYS